MNLQIVQNARKFEVIGDFTLNNTIHVKEHFNYLLDHYDEVVMSLKKVQKIDHKGIQVLKDIYSKANRRSKVLFVFGRDNNIIRKAFEKNKVNYIFKENY